MYTQGSTSKALAPATRGGALISRRQNAFARRVTQQGERVALVHLTDARNYEFDLALAAEMLTDSAEETVRLTEECRDLRKGTPRPTDRPGPATRPGPVKAQRRTKMPLESPKTAAGPNEARHLPATALSNSAQRSCFVLGLFLMFLLSGCKSLLGSAPAPVMCPTPGTIVYAALDVSGSARGGTVLADH